MSVYCDSWTRRGWCPQPPQLRTHVSHQQVPSPPSAQPSHIYNRVSLNAIGEAFDDHSNKENVAPEWEIIFEGSNKVDDEAIVEEKKALGHKFASGKFSPWYGKGTCIPSCLHQGPQQLLFKSVPKLQSRGTRKGKDQGHPSQAAHQDGTFDEDEPPAEPPARTGAKGGKKVEVVKVVPPQSKLLKSKAEAPDKNEDHDTQSDPDTGYEDTLPAQKRKISAKASKHLAKQDAHSTHLQQENTTNKPQKAKKALATVKESQKSSHTESLPTTKGQSTSLMVGQSLPLTEPSSVNKSQKDAGVALHNECGEQLNVKSGVSKEGSVDLDKMFNLHYLTYKTLAAHANIPEPHDAMQPTTSAPPFISVASASLPSSTAEHPLVQHSSMPARLAGIEEGYPSVTPGNGRLTVQDVPTEDLYCVPGEGALHGEQVDGHYATSREQDNITALAGTGRAEGPYYTPGEGPLCDGQGPLHYSVEQVNTAAGKGTLQEPPLPLNNYTSSGRAEDLYCAPGEGACCVEDGASHYWEQVNVTAVRGSSQEPPPPVNNYKTMVVVLLRHIDYRKASTLTIDQAVQQWVVVSGTME
ncbi:hypothetical protein SERLADRAFT_409085 [Serpula lacrymans var. lacrymans S7.9]|uniref:Uncharacterized protein n=1 Tax=Serpula lacrymans var. lacrymans (strain S7.9) TaxID=578457 RepID=F8NZ08_SERL9|nr:uncharacterized protein SERLADRAFT_409085 [Serpula lacrymans var. lacrymans S7.9]EGO23828.1 hypothetical protein SERLADRAFT_409085 [Serpula lacrymans var. lacrymans S7.9]